MDLNSLQWTKAFIEGKRQFVEIDSKRSDTRTIDCGLLQGNNLSQTCFSLVINDVTNQMRHCKSHLYADDQSIHTHTQTDRLCEAIQRVNADVESVNQWMLQRS